MPTVQFTLRQKRRYKAHPLRWRVCMADETFEMFVQRERARLHGECEAIFTQQQELENKLAGLNRELAAIDAYETAKSGKSVSTRGSGTRPGRRSRRGSKREQLLQIIK